MHLTVDVIIYRLEEVMKTFERLKLFRTLNVE